MTATNMTDVELAIVDAVPIATGLGAGLLLGVMFFAGLWWTVDRALLRTNVALWLAASYLIRFALLAGSLYVLSRDNPVRGVAACLGVIVSRAAVSHFNAITSAGDPTGERLR